MPTPLLFIATDVQRGVIRAETMPSGVVIPPVEARVGYSIPCSVTRRSWR